jgi:hypothetical protein
LFMTPESCRAERYNNLASHMEQYGQSAHVYLQRPRGKKSYFAVQSAKTGAWSSVTAL